MALSLKRTLTLVLLICVVSGAFFIGRTLGASSQTPPVVKKIKNLMYAQPGAPAPYTVPVTAVRPVQDPPPNVPPAEVFEEVLSNIQRNFVEINDIPLSKLDSEAIGRMYASLGDPKTHALNVERRKARQAALLGKYSGIGAVLTITHTKKNDVDYSHLTVMDVMPGSPAEKIGLHTGDYITEIDGRWIINYMIYVDADRIANEKNRDDTLRQQEVEQVRQKFYAGLSLSRALDRLEMGEGKTYALTVMHRGQSMPVKLSVTTALTHVEPVEFRMLEGKIGYVRIRQFNAKATEAFGAALDKIDKADKSAAVKGLIVDLRQNPGGVTAETPTGVDGYSSAKNLIARLTHGGTVAGIEHKPRKREALTVVPDAQAFKVPLIVLVDSGTANLAELAATALRDAGKAKIIGDHTFGDDVLQMFALLKNGSGVELTTAHLFTRSGVDLAQGLDPDIVVPCAAVPNAERAIDTALDRALKTLGSY